MADAMMMFLGEAHGVNWYWAQPGEFENPGVYYWDGAKNVLCVPHISAPEAPATAVVQVPQGWRLEVDESAIYHNDKRIAVLEEDGGNQSWRDACALGQQIVDRMNAAHEAPAQADPMEKLTRIQEELGLYNDKPAQAIPAPWREAVKVAREQMMTALAYMHEVCPYYPGDHRARDNAITVIESALAQLDALEGGK